MRHKECNDELLNPQVRLIDGEVISISRNTLSDIYNLPEYITDKLFITTFAKYTSVDGRTNLMYSDDYGKMWTACSIIYPHYEKYDINSVEYIPINKFFRLTITIYMENENVIKEYTSPDGLSWYYEVSRDMIPGYKERMN